MENESLVSTLCRQLKICNRRGLHARASARFVSLVNKFDVEVRVAKDGMKVGGTSIMGLMMLAAGQGSQIKVTASGEQAEAALEAIEDLVNRRFGEDE